MKKIIGIDTGGTYTDLVAMDAKTKKILAKNKTLTTKNNLKLCIEASFESLQREMLADVSMVCLSTTLATNAIVEGHGCKVGLILIGGRPKGKMVSRKISVIKGKYDIKGRLEEPIDIQEVRETVKAYKGKVDAIAISGYASIRNPSHELYVKQIAEQMLEIPVACAHELTSSLGFYERTVTVNLNAKLIPMIRELMDAVKNVMNQYSIDAPLMIVKGDGSLMTDVCARSKSIETILSGPAASVIGGLHLSGEKDAFIVDMGGTTTDIANVTSGKIAICEEGAKVGGWSTHVKAAEIFTIGIGGDSRIWQDASGNMKVGPEKSMPLCLAVQRYPGLKQEIKSIYDRRSQESFGFRDHEAYILIKKHGNLSYDDDERVIIEVLRYTPHTVDYLKKNINIEKLTAILDKLVREGVIMRISLTPTDILHITGEYEKWDSETAKMIVKVMCSPYKKPVHLFIEEIKKRFIEKLNSSFVRAAFHFDNHQIDLEEVDYKLSKKIIGIGAPARAWLSKAGAKLHTKVSIPEHAEVANAVGAAVGKALETVEILIRPDSLTNQYLVYSPLGRKNADTLETATEYALQAGAECIQRMSENREYTIEQWQEDECFEDTAKGKTIFMERRVILSAQFRHMEKR